VGLAVVVVLVVAAIVLVLQPGDDAGRPARSSAPSTSMSPQQAALPPLPSLPDAAGAVPASGGALPPAGGTPDGLGSDAALDRLARSCYRGDMTQCDALYAEAPEGSSYARYGDTCGERQPAGTGAYCTDAFPA
jgi:hypothetical protein